MDDKKLPTTWIRSKQELLKADTRDGQKNHRTQHACIHTKAQTSKHMTNQI